VVVDERGQVDQRIAQPLVFSGSATFVHVTTTPADRLRRHTTTTAATVFVL